MIRRSGKKKNKFKKSKQQILVEYFRTIAISFAFSLFVTILLSFHARSEMIKNLYVDAEEQQTIDETIARQVVTQSDLTRDLRSKKYAVCMHVGKLYETAHDFYNAQIAYEFAVEKAPSENYHAYYKLASALIAQNKLGEAKDIINSVRDIQNKSLIKFKSRAYIEMGDKYYSQGKFLSSAKSYEQAKYYYDKFAKKDKVVDESIKTRIVNAYIETANVMVKSGQNSDAVRFLKKAEKYAPKNFEIRYKLAIVYSDLDPIKSVDYFEKLLEEQPQNIDYGVYTKALMKASTIAELQGDKTKAKYLRYKIHSVDLFINRKVVYKNDVDVILDSFKVRKFLFRYQLKAKYRIKNNSSENIRNLSADFVLRKRDKVRDITVKNFANKERPLRAGGETNTEQIKLGKSIFTKKELNEYAIDIYLYKDEKYKTLISSIPVSTLYSLR